MKVDVIHKNYNKIFKRNEIAFKALQEGGEGTPPRYKVREELAKVLREDVNKIFLIKMVTKTGTNVSSGVVNVYENIDAAREVEPEYILKRNMSSEG
ncbi:MAG: hypothetical protein QXL67_00440 [Candidatus Bathyarchaeia archaeon]